MMARIMSIKIAIVEAFSHPSDVGYIRDLKDQLAFERDLLRAAINRCIVKHGGTAKPKDAA